MYIFQKLVSLFYFLIFESICVETSSFVILLLWPSCKVQSYNETKFDFFRFRLGFLLKLFLFHMNRNQNRSAIITPSFQIYNHVWIKSILSIFFHFSCHSEHSLKYFDETLAAGVTPRKASNKRNMCRFLSTNVGKGHLFVTLFFIIHSNIFFKYFKVLISSWFFCVYFSFLCRYFWHFFWRKIVCSFPHSY